MASAKHCRPVHALPRSPQEVVAPFEQARVRLHTGGGRRRARAQAVEGELEAARDAGRDLVLDGEDVGKGAVEALAPHVAVGAHVDELRRDPDAALDLPHAALDSVRPSEPAADLGDVAASRVGGERRHARDDPKPGQPRERVDDLVGKTVAEIRARFRSQVGEREHHQTGLGRWGAGPSGDSPTSR